MCGLRVAFWQDEWKSDSYVSIDGDEMLAGRVDILQVLEGLPDERVAEMQTSIEKHAHMMHFAYDDIPGDGLDVALRGIADRIDDGWDLERNEPEKPFAERKENFIETIKQVSAYVRQQEQDHGHS